MIRASAQEITNVSMVSSVWLQASMPARFGGLGIRREEEVAISAFLASTHSVANLVSSILPSPVCLEEDPSVLAASGVWKVQTGSEFPPLPLRGVQKQWDGPCVEINYNKLLKSAGDSLRDKARLLSTATKESSASLHALPISSLGNRLDDDSLRIAVALRLGAPMCYPHVCTCGHAVDSLGHHGLSCRRSMGRRPRHGAMNEILRRGAVSGGVPAILEPPGLCRDDGKRPDGLSLVPWKGGKSLVWDATCVDTLAASHLSSTSVSAGSAATKAEKEKVDKYSSLCHQFAFVQFGVETLGAWGQEAKSLACEIGRRIAARTCEKRAHKYLVQAISIAIQRGNASSILATIPQSKSLDEIYFLL